MAKEKKRLSGHYRDRTICGLACFAFAYVVAGALMASLGIRVVLEYPLFKTGSVIWGGILVFAIGVYILALSRCMEYLNKLKVAVILIMQILVCVVCIANIPILKCVEWKYFNGALKEDGEVLEDSDIIYIAYLLTLVGTVIGLVSSVFGISYTVVITHRIRSRLNHYLADIERIHQSSERKMVSALVDAKYQSPIYDDTGDVIPRQVAGRGVNVSPCSWVFHDGFNEQQIRTERASYGSTLPLGSSTSCCDDTVLVTSLDSMQNRFMDKRLSRQQPVAKHQTQEPHFSQVAIQDYLSHEEKTMIPPNPCLRHDQVLEHPSARPPSVISIVSSPAIKRMDSLTAETVVSETGLNSTNWAAVDHSASWPSPPSCLNFNPVVSTKQIVFNDDVIPAPLNFQDEPIKNGNPFNLQKCLVPEVIIARPPEPPKCAAPEVIIAHPPEPPNRAAVPEVRPPEPKGAVDENDNSVVSAYHLNSLTPRTFKHLITFNGHHHAHAVKPLMADRLDSPVQPDLSYQGSMCNLMGDPSPLFDMTCTRL